MKYLHNLRVISAVGLIVCVGVIALAFFLEYEYMLAACPLCILQRIVFGAMAVVFLIGTVVKIRPNIWGYLYSSTLALFAFIGAAIAARQIWLQYFAPPQKISCAASLERLMDLYPVFDALKIALSGSGECAVIDFKILGLSIAVWSFILFAVMAVVMLRVLYLQKKRRI